MASMSPECRDVPVRRTLPIARSLSRKCSNAQNLAMRGMSLIVSCQNSYGWSVLPCSSLIFGPPYERATSIEETERDRLQLAQR